jgi:predicted Zn-dependent protease
VTSWPASYNDGATAARWSAVLRADDVGVWVEREGRPAEQWHYDAIAVIGTDHGLVLGRRGSLARLTIHDRDAAATIRAHLAALPGRRRRTVWRSVAVVGMAVVFVLAGFAVALHSRAAARFVVTLVPPSWEAPLGDAVIGEVGRQFADAGAPPWCTGDAGRRALDRMTARLVAAGGPAIAPVAVVNGKTVNALTMPGGRIALFRGLIDQAQSPDELAGVLAHEMGHVRHRHSMQMLVTGVGLGLLLQLVTADVTGGTVLATATQVVVISGFTRPAEHEADADAKRVLGAAGIGSQGLAEFFDRLAASEKAVRNTAVFRLIATHPNSTERAQLFRDGSRTADPVLTPQEWQAIKTMCKR